MPMDEAPMMGLASLTPDRGAAPEATSDPRVAAILREAIEALGESDREVINLRHVGGLSFKQMADALDEPLGTLLTATAPGRVELARAALALLALWALALARRPGLALAFAAAALAASGATGHAAAIHPTWSVPAKAIHVAAVAVWLGGLAVLFATARAGDDFRGLAMRVSSLSLAAVVVLTVTGVLQTLLFVPGLGLLVCCAYGAVILAKLVGLGALVAIGARNRIRLVPGLPAEGTRAALRRAVAWELVVMTMVLLAAGLLAYAPVPRPDLHPGAHATHMEMN